MTGFDTGILIVYGMCPPVELAQYYQMDPATQSTHFMRGTHTEVWGDDMFEVMHTTAAAGVWIRVNRVTLHFFVEFMICVRSLRQTLIFSKV